MHSHSVTDLPTSPVYVLLLQRYLVEAGIMEEHGVPPRLAALDAGSSISVAEQLDLMRELTADLPPGWGLRLGRTYHAAVHGPLGFAFLSAPDLGASLGILERYGPVWLPGARTRTATREDGRYKLAFEPAYPIESGLRTSLLELASMARKNLLESVLGGSMAGVSFDFDYPAPAYADLYEKELGAPAYFDRSVTAMCLPESLLERRCPTADAAVFETSVGRLQKRERDLARRDFIVADVEDLLVSAGDAGMSIDEAARALRTSRRSLTRRLAEAGTTFRELRDRHRRDRAERMLRDPSWEISEIAWRLGYRDVANFGRAAQRWFGMPPGRFRRSSNSR